MAHRHHTGILTGVSRPPPTLAWASAFSYSLFSWSLRRKYLRLRCALSMSSQTLLRRSTVAAGWRGGLGTGTEGPLSLRRTYLKVGRERFVLRMEMQRSTAALLHLPDVIFMINIFT